MSQKIADKDITQRNELGQNVLVVPKGQPVPDDLEAAAAATVPIRQAEVEQPEPKAKPKRSKSKK